MIKLQIGKDPTTVSKEVKKHVTVIPSKVKLIKPDRTPIDGVCPNLMKAPFVCNFCKERRTTCVYAKHFYYAKRVYEEYEILLREAREGIPLNKEKFYEMDRVVSDGVKRASIFITSCTHDLGVSKSTVYRHLKRGYLTLSAVDFPRIVKFKPRKPKPFENVPKAVKVGRTYGDFFTFIEENGITSWGEMVTVIGLVGGKAIMTLHFTFCDFIVCFFA